MNIQLMSDLHFEFHRDSGTGFVAALDPSGVDVLVLAGDIFVARFMEDAASAFEMFSKRYPHVIYLPGNHEYYRSTPADADRLIAAAADRFENLTVLRPGVVVELHGRRFLGDTLWFDGPAAENARYAHALNDFQVIRQFVPWVYERNQQAREFLRKEMRTGDIVVTHHLPAQGSVADEYRGSELNRFFVSDEQGLIEERQPALWLHGHTHGACDYYIGKTRVVCNPLGYPQEAGVGAKFDEKLVIQL